MNVIIYCRVSSDEQADGTSLDFQERVLREYCARNNYNVLHCCREDFSAKHHDFRRPQMQWLRDYCRKHKREVEMILFLRWDRFSRNTEFAHVFKRIFLDEMGILFNAVENPIDFESTEWSTLFNLYAGIAQTENAKISRRTRDGIRETLLKGKCANKAPRGYKNVRTSKHDTSVEIDEAVAPLVRLLFNEVAKGLEAPDYIRKKYACKKNYIAKSSYLRMLRNIFYVGKIRIPASKNQPEMIVNGQHTPLIDEATFYAVQDVLDGKRKKSVKVNKNTNPDLFLRKFIVCPCCGRPLTGSFSKGNGGKYAYYHCCNQKHGRFRSTAANELFYKHLSCLIPHERILNLYGEILKDIKKDNNKGVLQEISKLEKEMEKLRLRLNRVEDDYMDGVINAEQYKNMYQRTTDNMRETESKIEQLRSINKTKVEAQLNYSINLINNIDKFMEAAPVEVKIKLIGSIFSEKIEFDGKNYRTNSYNQVLDLIYQQTKELQGHKNKKLDTSCEVSNSVPGAGLEPAQPQWSKDFKSFVSTIPPSGQTVSERRDSNPRP